MSSPILGAEDTAGNKINPLFVKSFHSRRDRKTHDTHMGLLIIHDTLNYKAGQNPGKLRVGP